MKRTNIFRAVATLGISTLALVGCSPVSDPAGGPGNGDEAELSIAVVNGWQEGIVVSEVWKFALEEVGYDVSLEYADAAPMYTGLANGDYDVTLDAWLPTLHRNYLDEFGDQLVDMGSWNDDAVMALAVNDEAPITSLDELAENAHLFDNKIYGIDPGASYMESVQDVVIPEYGLEDMELVLSSSPGMLTQLQRSIDNGENVVVTMWRPHWAYAEYPIRDLEDPRGAFGEAESLHAVGTGDFASTHPTAAAWIEDFEMDSDMLFDLQNRMFNSYTGDDYASIVSEWVPENREYVDNLTE